MRHYRILAQQFTDFELIVVDDGSTDSTPRAHGNLSGLSAYMLLELLRPGSFLIPAVWRIGPSGDPRPALVYFSFVTLTIVGYGDITPAWPGAGGLAAAEAVVGQLYLAITIARLVGLHTSQRTQ